MAGIYNRGKYLLASGSLDWTGGDIVAVLVDGSYTFDAEHNVYSDISGELTDGSYASIALTGTAVDEDDTAGVALLLANAADFGALDNETPEGLILLQLSGGTAAAPDASSPLIAFFDSGFGASADGLGYVVRWGGSNQDEVLRLTEV